MFNLMSQLTQEDRQKIENYISRYGVGSNFIGLDAWLQYWATCKIKLYKMLNNSLIYKVPFECEKPRKILMNELKEFLSEDSTARDFEKWAEDLYWRNKINKETLNSLLQMTNYDTVYNDKISTGFKIRIEGASRELQIQPGMKPIRAMGKVINYFKDSEEYDGSTLQEMNFEAFRIKHSQILNDKKLKGNIVFSIHPLDFMTMSDNASKWHSCMSWQQEGCYHVGTVEMMNSNNVICCYLESSEPYYFNKGSEPVSEELAWANKKWRQLIYVTKDIIVSGKAYPFQSEKMTQKILEVARELASKNLNWRYSFGPELYQDMKYVKDAYAMNQIRDYIADGNTTKHNIIFDTKGMYNDMLNDQYTKYWCVRNKVKHNKIISYSGKAPCLCCGKPVIQWVEDDADYYNDRYTNTDEVICIDCLDNLFYCNVCGENRKFDKIHFYTDESGFAKRMCDDCWNLSVRICPDCGKPMIIDERAPKMYLALTKDYDEQEIGKESLFCYRDGDYPGRKADLSPYKTAIPIFMHQSCAKKHVKNFKYKIKNHREWWGTFDYVIASPSCASKYENYAYDKLESPEYVKDMQLTLMNNDTQFMEMVKKDPLAFLKNF